MLEEYFYWSLLHERWFIESNWKKLKSMYFSHIPKLMRSFVSNMIRKNVLKSAVGHGMSRFDDEQVLMKGKECLKALNDGFSEQGDFFLGEKLSSYDVSCYAFVSNIIHSELGPVLRAEAQKYQRLLDYDQFMYDHVFNK